ncbi:MAG: hypothetical protein AB1384_11210, partial [Actinomycetota bacterium]
MLKRTMAVLFIAILATAAAGFAASDLQAYSYDWSGGHDAAGATAPSDTWYFAEGCTRPGFDCWLCVMNPQAQPATLDISFLTPAGAEFQRTATVAPLSRYTLNVADVVGTGQDVSMLLTSDLAVVAERPMYFNYHANLAGGHDAAGATAPSDTWYFAEGCTRPGFDCWLCVMNPQAQPATL